MLFTIPERNIDINIDKSVIEEANVIVDISFIKKNDEIFYQKVKGNVLKTKSGKLVIKLPDAVLFDITDQQDMIDFICSERWVGKTRNPIRMYISAYKKANNLKKKRIELGISQEELAQRTLLSKRIIQGYEQNGVENASIYKVYKLSQTLDCSIEDLLDEEI